MNSEEKKDIKRVFLALKELKNLAEEDCEKILRKIALDAYTIASSRSPTITGFLKSNWDVCIDKEPPEEKIEYAGKVEEKEPDLDAIKSFSIVHVFNNTSYASYVENGTPKFAARPMIKPAYEEIVKVAEKMVAQSNKKKIK